MRAEIVKKVAVEVEKIIIDIHIRCVGADDDDDVPADFPMLKGNQWKATVLVDSGKILDWPGSEQVEMFCKVCDQGIYTLLGPDGDTIAVKDGYVPNSIVPGEYGDYVHLKISADGFIGNWPSSPSLDEFFEDQD